MYNSSVKVLLCTARVFVGSWFGQISKGVMNHSIQHIYMIQFASRALRCVLSNKMHRVAVQLQYDIMFKSSSAGVCRRVTHDQYELACRAERAKQPDSMSMFPERSEIPKDISRLQNQMHDHRCAQMCPGVPRCAQV